MEENITTESASPSSSTEEVLTAPDPEERPDQETDIYTDDNSFLRLVRTDDELVEFGFVDSIPEESTLYNLNWSVTHLYNLVLLIALFLIGKWLIDKAFLGFNSIWERW